MCRVCKEPRTHPYGINCRSVLNWTRKFYWNFQPFWYNPTDIWTSNLRRLLAFLGKKGEVGKHRPRINTIKVRVYETLCSNITKTNNNKKGSINQPTRITSNKQLTATERGTGPLLCYFLLLPLPVGRTRSGGCGVIDHLSVDVLTADEALLSTSLLSRLYPRYCLRKLWFNISRRVPYIMFLYLINVSDNWIWHWGYSGKFTSWSKTKIPVLIFS